MTRMILTPHNICGDDDEDLPEDLPPQAPASESKPDKKAASPTVSERLFKARQILLNGEVTPDLASALTQKLLAMASASDEPITLFISSPGGHVESGDSIHDIIRFINAPVRVIGTGWVASIATHIYLAVPREQRFSLPNTRFLLHQPSGGAGGQATDIAIQAREIVKVRERINRAIAAATGQTYEKVAIDTDRDFWMTPEEAKAYGIVGKIITHNRELTS
jgi:ATP-dependent Clp protease, protease subunit